MLCKFFLTIVSHLFFFPNEEMVHITQYKDTERRDSRQFCGKLLVPVSVCVHVGVPIQLHKELPIILGTWGVFHQRIFGLF